MKFQFKRKRKKESIIFNTDCINVRMMGDNHSVADGHEEKELLNTLDMSWDGQIYTI